MPASVESIRVDRAWLGAPAGTIGNPTVWVFAGAAALLAAGTAGHLTGTLPAWATIALNAVALYAIFTPLHEAMHGVAHEVRWINAAIGRLSGLALTITLPLFRGVHYEHHSHTNDPARDPDLGVARRPRWLLPLWCVLIPTEYRLAFYRRRLWRSRGQLVEALAVDVLVTGVARDPHDDLGVGARGRVARAGDRRRRRARLRVRFPAALSVRPARALLRHPHPARRRAKRAAARPEPPSDPPPVDHDSVVPLPAGLRRHPRRPGATRLSDRRPALSAPPPR